MNNARAQKGGGTTSLTEAPLTTKSVMAYSAILGVLLVGGKLSVLELRD